MSQPWSVANEHSAALLHRLGRDSYLFLVEQKLGEVGKYARNCVGGAYADPPN